MSRISTAQVFQNAQSHISKAKEKEIESSDRSASLKEITKPSQSPAEFVIAAGLKDDLSIRQTVSKNAAFANHMLTATENILAQGQELTQKIHELALTQSNSALLSGGAGARKAVLADVKGSFDSFIAALNTRFANRSLMAGTKSDKNAFSVDGVFLGNNEKINVEIDRGLLLPINLDAEKIILGKGLPDGVDIIATFKGLMLGLEMNDSNLIRESLPQLMRAVDQLSLGRTDIGARMSEMNRAIDTNSLNSISTRDAIAKIEEADPVKAFSDLARDQTILRAAIDTSHKILSETTSDILFR